MIGAMNGGHSAGQLYSDGGRQRGRVGPGQEQEILMVKQSVIGGIISETGRPAVTAHRRPVHVSAAVLTGGYLCGVRFWFWPRA